jgi:hypothetical protein
MNAIRIAGMWYVGLGLCFASAADRPPHAPTDPIVRSVEVRYEGASAADKERIMALLRPLLGHPCSERSVEEVIRKSYDMPKIGGSRIFAEPLSNGVKVVFAVHLVYRIQ